MKKKQRTWKALLVSSTLVSALSLSGISILAEGEGGQPAGGNNGGTPPSGSEGGGTPPDMPSGGTGAGGGGGANTQTYDYTGETSGALSADGTSAAASEKSYTADTADQNTALAKNGGTLTIDGVSLEKSGDDTNGDNCNFYGINSIALTIGSSSLSKIANSTLNATSTGSNGIFATDSGTVYAYKDTITTSADNSRGLDATYDGTIIADQTDITTQGDHCAAAATDRGGGNVSVTNSELKTNGSGSPLLYSTGDIEVDNVTGTASGSQIAGMEGLNTILIKNSSLTSSITSKTASDPVADGIIIYQSTSGDAESTTGSAALFQAEDSTLKSAITSGSMFYLTNTKANIVLKNTVLDFDSDKADLLMIAGNDANSWGTAGSNGASAAFTGLGETLKGNIEVDTISSLDAYFLDGTSYTGTISILTNAVNTKTADAPITVNLSSDSSWIVTGDSTVSALNAEAGSKIVDSEGKTVTIIANGETVVKGDSSYTITVTGSYSTAVTTDSDNEVSTSYIDRTGFDAAYGTSTSFAQNTAVNTASASAVSTASSSASASETSSASDHTALYIVGAIAVGLLAGCLVYFLNKKKK
ncbi:MAG: hypothetical protein LKF53_09695 [Solobacterium sp.]|nr:hypothetical protein [Solobacterium sp.]MCH4206642.1 hypothetical protein [Solobacterium sp.]MCH4228062.1 hypothetical protein [Solobacterium sp.]MCH4282625.1 hypothetical protein [Solobacterium sp.]